MIVGEFCAEFLGMIGVEFLGRAEMWGVVSK